MVSGHCWSLRFHDAVGLAARGAVTVWHVPHATLGFRDSQ